MFTNKSLFFVLFLLQSASYSFTCSDSCLNRTNSFGTYTCFCSECDQYDDCCYDVQLPIEKPKNQKCNVKISSHEYIYSISKCASWWLSDGLIKNNCEHPEKTNDLSKDLLSFLPVFSNKTRKAYKNIYCASCNIEKIDFNTIKTFQLVANSEFIRQYGIYIETNEIEAENYTNKVINEFLNGNTNIILSLEDKPSLYSLRKCIRSIGTCPLNSTETQIKQCQNGNTSYRYVRHNFEKVYRNEYCALCNNENLNELICKPFSLRGHIQKLFDVSKLLENQIDGVVCQNEEESIDEIIKKYITVTGHLVSIISIILLLIVYSTSKKLRNFPGKLLICLSVCLLLAQTVFILANYFTSPSILSKDCLTKNNQFDLNEIYKPCYILAFLTHYFYLSFFAWSNIMAFDLYHMFSILTNSKSKSASINHEDLELKSIRFIKYSAYAWCIPLLICIALVVKQFLSNNLAYGFKMCFISDPFDLLIFFVLPIALVLLTNVFFLISSIISIRKVDKMTNKFLKKEEKDSSSHLTHESKEKKKMIQTNNAEKKRLILYLKLFILTGMTWILGVIVSFSKESFIWHIYIVLNSLQGLFIFVSFAFSPQSRRVLKSTRLYSRISSNMFRKSTLDSGRRTSSSIINSQKA